MSTTNKNIVKIQGRDYMTVAGRVQEAARDFLGLETEVLFQEPVVVKATVLTTRGKFTGISAANPSKSIEKQSPYEIAETSAVGRALGFAGYGSVESIASADEMYKATHIDKLPEDMSKVPSGPIAFTQKCDKCHKANMVLNPKTGKFFCEDKCWLKPAMPIDDVPTPSEDDLGSWENQN